MGAGLPGVYAARSILVPTPASSEHRDAPERDVTPDTLELDASVRDIVRRGDIARHRRPMPLSDRDHSARLWAYIETDGKALDEAHQ